MKNSSHTEEENREKRERLRAQLERESKLVSEDSMRMNAILEVLEDGNDQI